MLPLGPAAPTTWPALLIADALLESVPGSVLKSVNVYAGGAMPPLAATPAPSTPMPKIAPLRRPKPLNEAVMPAPESASLIACDTNIENFIS